MLARRVVPALLALAAFPLAAAAAQAHGLQRGAVFTLTNATTGNAVAVFDRGPDGTLSAAGTVATGGTGTGGNLGSQGAIVLSRDGHHLFAVNAGSNSIAELAVRGDQVRLVATVSSGGTMPISVTVHGRFVYVLNAGGSGNIAGFQAGEHGLTPLAGSVQPLGAGSAGPAEVAFTPDGSALVVTEKTSSTIDTYPVSGSGVAGSPAVTPSAGKTPFGFDFDRHGHLLVSEAGGTASSYAVSASGASVITGALATGQAAPCWLVRAGRFAYTANGGSGTLSGFRVGADGTLTLLDPSGVTANIGAGSHPLDETVTRHGGRFLYNLTDGLHRITGFRIGHDGSLSQVDVTTGLPVGAAGIVAS
jgi:6-phosphogluconolactonase (cycloisomerase 2 family)